MSVIILNIVGDEESNLEDLQYVGGEGRNSDVGDEEDVDEEPEAASSSRWFV